MKRLALLVVLLGSLAGSSLLAQDTGHTESLAISWPPPVTEVWGIGDVLGTANIPNMVTYFLEYMPLNDDLSLPVNAPWLPGTLAISTPVTNGVLATLDTRTVADGLYALRLTAATTDGQVFHDVVSPIRVDNARFSAVEARIRGEASAAPTATEPQAPADNTPRVTPADTAVNVRRCDLVDNDRCPIFVQIPPGTFAEITGRNPANTFYQVRLPSGASGWASRTVVAESGNVSSVPIVNPPEPLPAPVLAQPIAPIGVVTSAVVPNGLAIQGTAVCNQPFNVQINLTNTGSTSSPAGSVTLQDFNTDTGTVTFSGTASYPVINPGGNFVAVVPVATSAFFGPAHQLRAFANGREITIPYSLAQGNCAAQAQPAPPARGQRNFAAGECTLVVSSAGLSAAPEGQVTFVVSETGTYAASQVQAIGGLNWYQISYADNPAWLPANNVTSFQGNCNP